MWTWMWMWMYPKMRDWFKPNTTITLFIPSFRRSFKSKKKLWEQHSFSLFYSLFSMHVLCDFVFVYVSEHLYITKYHVLYNFVSSIVTYHFLLPPPLHRPTPLNLPTKHIVTKKKVLIVFNVSLSSRSVFNDTFSSNRIISKREGTLAHSRSIGTVSLTKWTNCDVLFRCIKCHSNITWLYAYTVRFNRISI